MGGLAPTTIASGKVSFVFIQHPKLKSGGGGIIVLAGTGFAQTEAFSLDHHVHLSSLGISCLFTLFGLAWPLLQLLSVVLHRASPENQWQDQA